MGQHLETVLFLLGETYMVGKTVRIFLGEGYNTTELIGVVEARYFDRPNDEVPTVRIRLVGKRWKGRAVVILPEDCIQYV